MPSCGGAAQSFIDRILKLFCPQRTLCSKLSRVQLLSGSTFNDSPQPNQSFNPDEPSARRLTLVVRARDHVVGKRYRSSPSAARLDSWQRVVSARWWDRGDVEEVRSAEGGAAFLSGIPRGWSVEPCAYHPFLEQRLSFSVVAAVKVCVELAALLNKTSRAFG